MDFYEGQVVTVLEECHNESDDVDFYSWHEYMDVFCGHKYIISDIAEDGRRIHLRETEESEGITDVDGSPVSDYYFCEYWLAPYNETQIVESDALVDFFDNF